MEDSDFETVIPNGYETYYKPFAMRFSKTFKRSSGLFCLLFFQLQITAQQLKEQQFISTVKSILTAFSKQDSISITKFVHKDLNVFQLHRNGVFNTFVLHPSISFGSEYPYILFTQSKGIQLSQIRYEALPKFSCNNDSWSKTGIFVDTTRTDHLLSNTSKDHIKYGLDTFSSKKIQSLYTLEKKSRRVVAVDRNGKELVFYLSYLAGKWYLTIIDFVSSDCSA